jgi:hypothetical protein
MRRGKSCLRRKSAALPQKHPSRPLTPTTRTNSNGGNLRKSTGHLYSLLDIADTDEIIHEHSPIFTPAGRAMMAALFRISKTEDAEGPRQMRLYP